MPNLNKHRNNRFDARTNSSHTAGSFEETGYKKLTERGKGVKFDLRSEDNIYVVSGDDSDGRRYDYVFGDGRYCLIGVRDGDMRVLDFGRIGEGRHTEENYQDVVIGEGFHDIAEVDQLERMTSTEFDTKRIADPKIAEREYFYRRLLNEADVRLTENLARAVGDTALSTIRRAESATYDRRKKKLSNQETFNYKGGLLYENLESNLYLATSDNFISPNPRALSTYIKPPRELRAYQEQEARSVKETPRNFSTRKKTEQEQQQDPQYNERIRNRISHFMTTDPRAVAIYSKMNIQPDSIESLSPKQTVELIGRIMYEVTSYDFDATGSNVNPADNLDAYEILRRGIGGQGSRREVDNLGICRNFADTARSVFEALKEVNPKLQNVYCFNRGGYGGVATGTIRSVGHAWLDFVMVTSEQDMMAISVDPTRVKKQFNGELRNYYRTRRSAGVHIRTMYAFDSANYGDKKDRNAKRIGHEYTNKMRKKIRYLMNNPDFQDRDGKFQLENVPRDNNALQELIFDAIEMRLLSGLLSRDLGLTESQQKLSNVLVRLGADLDPRAMPNAEKRVIYNQLREDYEATHDYTKKAVLREKMKEFESSALRAMDVVNDGAKRR